MLGALCHDLKYKAGYVSQIFSDKTGTLTQNRMTLVRAYVDGEDAPEQISLETALDNFGKVQVNTMSFVICGIMIMDKASICCWSMC